MKPRINREWHLANKMPKDPTLDQRVAWHLDHRKNCSCRTDLPISIRQELQRRGIEIPAQSGQGPPPPT